MITRVALPVHGDWLAPHFGEAPAMAFFEVDQEDRTILRHPDRPTPPHEPGVLPWWLARQQVDLVIAGGMGERAVLMLADAGIRVIAGVSARPALEVVAAWRDGKLTASRQTCSPCDNHEGHGQ